MVSLDIKAVDDHVELTRIGVEEHEPFENLLWRRRPREMGEDRTGGLKWRENMFGRGIRVLHLKLRDGHGDVIIGILSIYCHVNCKRGFSSKRLSYPELQGTL